MVRGLNMTYRAAGEIGLGSLAALVFRDGDGNLVDVVTAGVPRKRVAWLPIWLRFNSWFDYGPEGVEDAARQWVADYTFKAGVTVSVEET